MSLHRLSPFAALLAYLCLAVAYLGANPWAGETVGPFNLLAAQKAWTQPGGHFEVGNHESTDVLDALLPRWIEARNVLRAGRLPLWNPLPGGGESGIHNPANALLTPAFAIFAASSQPAMGFYLATLFDLTLIGVGCFLWLLRHLRPGPAFLAGLTVMLCGFHAAWLFWPHTLTSMWICWLLWAVDGWWFRRTSGRFALMVAAATLLLLGGFPFVAELGLGATLLYACCLYWVDRRSRDWHPLGAVMAAMMIAFAICAIPIAELALWLHSVDSRNRVSGSFFYARDITSLLFPWSDRRPVLMESAVYAGTCATVLAVAGWVLSLRRLWGVSAIGLFGLLLGAVGLTLVFELIPAAWLAWVPGLGNNPWSRASILLDIAMATSAAFAIDALMEKVVWKALGYGLLAAIVLLQGGELGWRFRAFDGPVPSRYFYPSTPIIDRMAQTVTPFESVVADDSFLVSGTLGGYGLREWAAHSFKTQATKAALSQIAVGALTTPTASVMRAEDIRLDSPMLDALAVRYVVGDDGLVFQHLAPEFGRDVFGERKPLPPLPENHWVQSFSLSRIFSLTGIRLRLASYGRTDLHGMVRLKLFDARHASPVATADFPAGRIVDGQMMQLHFPEPVALVPGTYRFTLTYDGAAPGEAVTVWYAPVRASNCALELQDKPVDGCLLMEWLSERRDGQTFTEVAAQDGIHLLRNNQAPAGPYFLHSLDVWPSRGSDDEVTSTSHAWQSLSLTYRGANAGFVVIPMNGSRDWRFTVNGKPAQPQRYLGVMPAIAVAGPAVIEARFEPTSIALGRWIMLAGLLVLVALGWISQHRKRHFEA